MPRPTLTRRRLLRTALPLAAVPLLQGCGDDDIDMADDDGVPEGEWQNWAKSVRCNPRNGLQLPETVDELAGIVAKAKGPVRAVGAGHSFAAVVPTDDTLLSIEALTGIVRHDPKELTATIRAGTRLFLLGPQLAELGQGLPAQPDVDLQSLAGALSTCSHGAGAQHRCMPHTIQGLQLVTADGRVLDLSPTQQPQLFEAARVSLGTLGVLTEVTLRNRTKYLLKESTFVMPLDQALAQFATWQRQDRHSEFFAFPRGNTAYCKRMSEVSAETPLTIVAPALEEKELGQAAELAMRAPWTIAALQRIAGWFVPDTVRIGASYHIFPTVRQVPFNEMEYAVAAEHGPACFREVVAAICDQNLPVFFPLEYRHVGADDLWLSPYHGRESVTISVHQYHKQDHAALFRAVEPIFWKYDGRPHWGKWHSLTAARLANHYPHWGDFQRARKELDPAGKFLNPYLKSLFEV